MYYSFNFIFNYFQLKNIYIIFDETEINNNTQMLWCIVIDDEIFFWILKEQLNLIKFKRGFWELKNDYPHYTEDSYNQRSMLMDLYSILPYKAYFNIIESSEIKKWFKDLYINHLIKLSKPLILKYKKIYWKNVVFNFWFDNINFLSIKEINEIINKFYEIEVDVKNIKKTDCNCVTSVIDYTSWCLCDFLKDINKWKNQTYWNSMFDKISNKVSLVKINSNNKEKFYYFHKDIEEFISDNHWKFAKS